MIKYLAFSLVILIGCKQNESFITIVDIGHLDRNGIAKELSVINKHSPKVVGLNFLLTKDSLQKDILLLKELSKTKNLVMSLTLHNNNKNNDIIWDSLEVRHPKFQFGIQGFSNITITGDSVVVSELPMRQYHNNQIVFAYSYQIAGKYDSEQIKTEYKNGADDYLFHPKAIGHYFKVISARDVLSGNFDKKDLTGKIVLIGYVGQEDSFYLRHNTTERISGVEIQASFIRAILN